MTEAATRTTGARRAPAPSLPLVPKEHGASFMSVHSLLLGIVAGVSAGGRDLAGGLLAIALGLLFLPLAGAVSVITHPRFAAAARRRVAVLGSVGAALGLLILWHGPIRELLIVATAGAVLGAGYALARTATGARSIPTQLFAIAGICLFAPTAWLLVAGPTDGWGFAAPAAFLAFGGTVPYVRERVRRRRLHDTTIGQRVHGGALALGWQAVALASAAALAAAGVVSWLLLVAFLPGAVKTAMALLREETRPPIPKIGYLETVISTVFAIVAGLALGLGP